MRTLGFSRAWSSSPLQPPGVLACDPEQRRVANDRAHGPGQHDELEVETSLRRQRRSGGQRGLGGEDRYDRIEPGRAEETQDVRHFLWRVLRATVRRPPDRGAGGRRSRPGGQRTRTRRHAVSRTTPTLPDPSPCRLLFASLLLSASDHRIAALSVRQEASIDKGAHSTSSLVAVLQLPAGPHPCSVTG